jgi:hypothetical protein
MMAALDAVAKLNANATPRATFRIIDFFLILKVTRPLLPDSKNRRASSYHRI